MNINRNKAFILNKVIYIMVILWFCHYNISFASVVKCSDFLHEDKNFTALGGSIDSCNKAKVLVRTTDNKLGDLTNYINQRLVFYKPATDADGNIPIYCSASNSTPIKTETVNGMVAGIQLKNNFSVSNINEFRDVVKLCGYDWNTYAISSNTINNNHKTKWYPDFGIFSNSYEYKLLKIFDGSYDCSDYFTMSNGQVIIKEDIAKSCLKNGTELDDSSKCSKFRDKCFPVVTMLINSRFCDASYCASVNISSRNQKNRFYREMMYDGEEFIIPRNANYIDRVYDNIIINDKQIYSYTDGCFDPRIEGEKGFAGNEQRYYFRGTKGANYACERFNYRGNPCLDAHGRQYPRNSEECEALFNVAKTCCERRSSGGVCIYAPDKLIKNQYYYTKIDGVNYDFTMNKDNSVSRSHGITFCSNADVANGSNICSLNIKGIDNVYYEVYEGLLNEGSKYINDGENSRKLCVRTINLFPYNFNLSYGTEIKDLYCDGDYIKCANPFNRQSDWSNYKRWDLAYGNDNLKIWKNSSDTENKKYTPFYANVKNFCEYNMHCVDYKESEEVYSFKNYRDNIAHKFLPEVCFNFDSGSSQNFKYPVRLDEMYLARYIGGGTRGFLAPMAECLTETIKNMFLNIAGSSSCKDTKETVNSEGLCGRDSFGKPAEIRHEKYNAEYSGDKNAYNYIIGEKLPENKNIFNRIQNTVRSVIIVFVMLSIVIASAKFLITGEFDVFGAKSVKAIIMMLIKIAIVLYFSLTDVWQTKFYNWLMESVAFINQKMLEFSFIDYDDYKNDFSKITCDVKKENEIVKKGKAKQCSYIKTREVMNNCTSYSNPGEYEFDILNNYSSLVIKLFGASSGLNNTTDNSNNQGTGIGTGEVGKGGYTYGVWDFRNNYRPNKLYIYVGGMASNANCPASLKQEYGNNIICGGYNGGGNGGYATHNNVIGYGGGGATDIRTVQSTAVNLQKSLDSRIMVAGGGGGASVGNLYSGGDGGGGNNPGNAGSGYAGGDTNGNRQCFGSGGTLTSGGIGASCDPNVVCETEDVIAKCINAGYCSDHDACTNNSKCVELCDRNNLCTFKKKISTSTLNLCGFNNGIFAQGGDGQDGYRGGSGGGGGYYGGGASSMSNTSISQAAEYMGGGGGGSGYINTNIISSSGGSNGANIGNGIAIICPIVNDSLENQSETVEVLEEYNDIFFNINELPQAVLTSGENNEVCIIDNVDEDINNNHVITKKCYTCGETILNSAYDNTTTETIYNQTNQVMDDISILPNKISSYEEYKISKLVKDDDDEKITEITYYNKCQYIIEYDENGDPLVSYDDRYDGCYFGNNDYPDGKDYLKIFDTLDCKILNYYGLSVGGGTIVIFLISCLLSATFGIFILAIMSFMLFLIFVLSFKVFYIYVTNIITITLLIFVSPIIFPFILISRYKSIFDNWLSNLMGACCQMIFLMGFIGFALLTIDNIVLGDGKYYNHDPYTGRLPLVTCSDEGGLSLLCFIANNPNKPADGEMSFGEDILNFLGLGPLIYSVKSIFNVGPIAIFNYLLSVLIVIYIMVKILDEIPTFTKRIFSAPDEAEGNMKFGQSHNILKDRGRDVANFTRGAHLIAVKNTMKAGRKLREGFKEWNKDGFKAGVKRTWGNVAKNFKKETWQQRGENIKNAAIKKANDVKDGAVKAYTTVKEAPGKAWNGVKRGASATYNFVKEAPGKAWNGVKNGANAAWTGIKSVPDNIVSSVRDKFKK